MNWRKRTVLEVRAVLGSGEVHLDVVEGFALAEVVVIGGGEETGAVAADDGLEEATVDVESESFESVHFGSDLMRVADLELVEGKGSRRTMRSSSFGKFLHGDK